ncbi:hypothetical protein EUTSA_v10025275mg [Eutrema salsugineum]|uniref:UBX domain-containing protein n=1 Tax=Eutrema salsugineum TaxID=72664 RepID=V4MRV7_EUTSA|nr:plant UBX domain-containing protein 5 [Eutrema salsugineum]ESQ55968.1 hypothetical protein EUTSA_v10025275mg [Eutrema salsugineum]
MEENKTMTMNDKLITSFLEITSSSREEATFFLESHRWDLDAAVSTFLDNDAAAAADLPTGPNPNLPPSSIPAASPSQSQSPDYSPSETSPSRSRSPSPPSRDAPYRLRSKGAASQNQQADKPSGSRSTRSRQHAGNIRTFADLNRSPAGGAGSDSDEAQEYYTGGEKSGMMVQDPRKAKDVDALFEQARMSAVDRPVEPSRPASRSFTGASRLLSGEPVSSSPQQQQQQDQPQVVMHFITFWRNGFTVDDGPLRRFDDPNNATFMESIAKSECPRELEPVDRKIRVHVDLIRREEDYTERSKPKNPFQGLGRLLGASGFGSSSSAAEPRTVPAFMNVAPAPSRGLVVDPAAPTTSIQLRLADGTRLVSRFNNHHTIRDIRGFIDASRPGGSKEYQLLTMGFPPKQLTDLDQTIEQAGIANSVVLQKV